jgi:hypothetical protein
MKKIISLILLSAVSSLLACPITTKDRLRIEKRANHSTHKRLQYPLGFAEDELEAFFNEAISRAEKFYSPIFEAKGLTFLIKPSFDSEVVNAFAQQIGTDAFIYLYGGMLRVDHMTRDAYRFTICHEVGHHLGGFPHYTSLPWATSEGGADYFATLKCMRHLLKDDPENKKIAEGLKLPAQVVKLCSDQFTDEDEKNICLRSSQASFDFGLVAYKIIIGSDAEAGGDKEVSLIKPEVTSVEKTLLNGYPDAQCRVDTIYAGAVCSADLDTAQDNHDQKIGTCTLANEDTIGLRPACWFVE